MFKMNTCDDSIINGYIDFNFVGDKGKKDHYLDTSSLFWQYNFSKSQPIICGGFINYWGWIHCMHKGTEGSIMVIGFTRQLDIINNGLLIIFIVIINLIFIYQNIIWSILDQNM